MTIDDQRRFFAIAKKIPKDYDDQRSLQGFVNRLYDTTLETLHVGAIIDTALATKKITKSEADFVWKFLAGEVKAATSVMTGNMSSPRVEGRGGAGAAAPS